MNPHQGQPVLAAGKPLEKADKVMIAIHGRGGGAQSILQLAGALNRPDWTYLAPQAQNFTWYPNRFVAPLEANEPHLSSALQAVDDLVTQVQGQGVPVERIMLMGFSQGACLALEFAARNPKSYGGVIGFSGGLIGPEGMIFGYDGQLDTPVFLGCGDVDSHIPLQRVRETTQALSAMGARVDERIYPGMDHTVNADEILAAQTLMDAI